MKTKRLYKSLLVLLVTFVMLFSIVPGTAFAENSGISGEESTAGTLGEGAGAPQASGGETPAATPAPDASAVVSLANPDGSEYASVPVDEPSADPLCWTLPAYAVDEAAYPGMVFEGWSDGSNVYAAGQVLQNLTSSLRLTAVVGAPVTAQSPVGAPPAQDPAHAATILGYLSDMSPNLVLAAGTTATTGMAYTALLTGSLSLPAGTELEDVIFEFETTTLNGTGVLQLMNNAEPGEFTGFTVEVLSSTRIRVTVHHLQSSTGGGSVEFARFQYSFPNKTTPNGLQATLELVSITCEGITLEKDDWKNEAYAAKVQQTLTAQAAGLWGFDNASGSNVITPTTFSRVEGVGADQVVWPIASASKPTFNLGASERSSAGTGFVSANGATFVVELSSSGNVVIPQSILSAFATSASVLGSAVFEEYFGLTVPAGWTATAVAQGGKLVMTFSNASLAATAASVKLSIKKVATTVLPTNDSGTGTYVASYVQDAQSYITYPSIGTAGPENVRVQMQAASTYSVSHTINFTAPKAMEDKVKEYLAGRGKTADAWYYEPLGYASGTQQYGDATASGGNSRSFVSKGEVVLDGSGNTITMDRVWFSWNLKDDTALAALPVTRLMLKETGANGAPATAGASAGWDMTQMRPIGFEMPTAATGTTLIITATISGLPVQVYNSGTSAVDAKFTTVTSGGKTYLMYLGNPAITAFSYAYTSATSVAVGSNPRVLFRVEPNAVIQSDDYIYNYSHLAATYKAASSTPTLDASQTGMVQYKSPPEADVTGTKTVQNLSRDTGGAAAYRPGDKLKYTINVSVNSLLPYRYINQLLLMDAADTEGITLDKNTMNTEVVIQYGSYGNVSSNRIVLDASHGVTPQVNGNRRTYTNVPSAYGGPLAGQGAYSGRTAHFYKFSGHLYQGDTITITYYATVADTAVVGKEYKNDVYMLANWGTGGGGGSINWGWAWKRIGGTSFGVSSELVYGDIRLTVRPADANGDMMADATHAQYLPGEAFYLDILGGLVQSSKTVQNPTYLVQLPENMQFAGNPQNLTTRTMTLNTVSGTREIGAATALNKSVTLQWLARGPLGALAETTREQATYMRLVVTTTLGVNELLGFEVPVKIADEIAGTKGTYGYADGTVKVAMTAMLVDSSDTVSIISNHKYQGTGGWPTTGTHEAFRTDDFSKALAYGMTGVGNYIFDSRPVRINHYRSWADIAKTKGEYPVKPSAGGQRQDGLYQNDTLDFTVKVTNATNPNMSTTYNRPGSFHPGPIVDILPDKMSLEGGTAKVTVDGADVPFTLTQTAITGGRVRLVVTLKDTNYQLAYGKTLVFTYTARLTSIAHLNGAYFLTATNEAAVYLDADKVYTSGKAIPKQGDISSWWTGINVPSSYSRLPAKVDLVIKDKTLALSVEKTATKPSYTITTSAAVPWSVKVTNAATSDLPLNGYQVVDVLPKDFAFAGMTSGPDPAKYTNRDGNTVLVWTFPAGSPLNIGETQTLTYNALAMATAADGSTVGGYYTNTAYVMPTTQDLAGATILNGILVANNDTVFTGQITLSNNTYIVPPRRAVRATNTVLLTSFLRAVAENTAGFNKNDTSSSTTSTLLEVTRGATVDYGFELKNDGNWVFDDISVYDALPYANDKYTMRTGARGSNFAMLLKNSVTFDVQVDGVSQSGFAVYYSAASVHGRAALTNSNNWKPAQDWVWSSGAPKSFRVDMPAGFELLAGQTLRVTWQMVVPDDVLVETASNPSYNSAGYYFSTRGNTDSYFAEPDRVGVYVADSGMNDLSVVVEKKLSDRNMKYKEQREFTFKLEKLNPSTGLYEAVQLDSSYAYNNTRSLHSTADPGTYGLFAMTAENYVTASGSISKLPAGTYRVTELPYDLSHYAGPDTYTVTGSGSTGYIGLQNGKTVRSFTANIYNLFDYYAPWPDTGSSTSATSRTGGGTSSRTPAGTTSRTGGTSRSGGTGTPISGGGVPTESVPDDEGPPLVQPGRHWALVNLICSVLSAIGAVFLLVMLLTRSLRKKKRDDEAYDAQEQPSGKESKTSIVWRILSIVAGIASIVTFILTEDMRQPWIWVDKWTPLMIAYVLVTIASVIGTWYAQRKRNEEDDGQDYYYPTA